MTLTTYEELEQGSPEWLAARCGIVTASVVGQLITPKTVKPAANDTSRALAMTLTAERITGYVEPIQPNRDMERGTLSEPFARDKYAEHYAAPYGAPVTEVGFMVRDFGGYRIGYSPDGLVGDDGLIEIKSPRQKKHLATILADEVPLENMAQCQAGLLVSGRDWCDFVSYRGGLPPYVKRVHADPKWAEAIVDAVSAFEQRAEEMLHNFDTATKGMPSTEPLTYGVELKLA